MDQRAYLTELQEIILSFPEERRRQFTAAFIAREKNPVIAFGLNGWLGWLGADMFYLGLPLLGVLKLITGGGCGIWSLINGFLIGGMTRDKNLEMARELKFSMQNVA
jgi:hypothetical protein